MSDFYTEQLVERKAPAVTSILKVIMIGITAVSFVFTLLIPFAIIVPIILVCVDVVVFRSMDLEYEYLFVNGNLDIDKIIAKSRRKRVFEMEITDLELIAPAGSPEVRQFQGLKAQNFSSCTPEGRKYEMIVVKNGEKRRIVFEPNEKILDGMRMYAPRKVFR